MMTIVRRCCVGNWMFRPFVSSPPVRRRIQHFLLIQLKPKCRGRNVQEVNWPLTKGRNVHVKAHIVANTSRAPVAGQLKSFTVARPVCYVEQCTAGRMLVVPFRRYRCMGLCSVSTDRACVLQRVGLSVDRRGEPTVVWSEFTFCFHKSTILTEFSVWHLAFCSSINRMFIDCSAWESTHRMAGIRVRFCAEWPGNGMS